MIGRSIYVRIAGTALIGILLFVEAHGAGSIYYGSRAGMEVTVVGVSGIGTTHAVIRVKHTRENARAFCSEYANDKSEACIDRTLRETRLNDQLEGNCETGWFTSLYGERLRFIGEAKHRDEIDPKYIILSDGKPLDGSSASGYSYDLEQLRHYAQTAPLALIKVPMSLMLTIWYNTKCPVCTAGIEWQRRRLVRAARAGVIEFRDINLEPDALSRFGAGVEDVRRLRASAMIDSPTCSTLGIAGRGIGKLLASYH